MKTPTVRLERGVTRPRWVLANLGWALLAAAAWGGALAALFTWWRGPDNAVDGPVKFIYFDVQGVAPVAYSVFAMALGIAVGALFRRVVPAIATTLVVFVAVRIVTALYLRQQFAVSRDVLPSASAPPLSYSLGADILPGPAGPTTACGQQGTLSCLAAHGYQNHITYLPAGRFWPVQGVESGIFLVLALALAIITYCRSRPVTPNGATWTPSGRRDGPRFPVTAASHLLTAPRRRRSRPFARLPF